VRGVEYFPLAFGCGARVALAGTNVGGAPLQTNERMAVMPGAMVFYEAAVVPGELVIRLPSAIRRHDLAEYGMVDHHHDMQAKGVVNPPEAYTDLFGNPQAGAAFLAKALNCTADMPIRVGIYGESGHSVLAYLRMSELLSLHHADLKENGQKVDDFTASLCQEIGAAPRV
jgi:uncharacterized protein (DUF302 family)